MDESPSTHWVKYLEMVTPPGPAAGPAPPGVEIVRVEEVDLEDYRRLYRRVGDPWNWFMRRRLDDDGLRYILEESRHELLHLVADGEVVGFAELDYRNLPDVELEYFGLVPEQIGRGLGGWFLGAVIADVWSRQVDRFWLHTCEFDHPRAVEVYESRGLRIYDIADEAVPSPDTYLW